jgi:hypothetical protein
MKRKAPETLLEFSEYILPLKRIKLHPEPESPPQTDFGYEESPYEIECDQYGDRVETNGKEDSYGDWPFSTENTRSATFTTSIVQDFYIDTILSDDLLAKKPLDCKEPIDNFVEAIKWLIESRRLIQRQVAHELDVRYGRITLKMKFQP